MKNGDSGHAFGHVSFLKRGAKWIGILSREY